MDTNAVLRLAQATGHVAKPQLTQARARRERQEAAKRMRVTRLDATRQCCLSVRTMLGAQAYAPCVCVQGEHFMGCSLSARGRGVVNSLCCACRGTGTMVWRSTAWAHDRPGDNRQGRVRHVMVHKEAVEKPLRPAPAGAGLAGGARRRGAVGAAQGGPGARGRPGPRRPAPVLVPLPGRRRRGPRGHRGRRLMRACAVVKVDRGGLSLVALVW
jgi:hypothetical protein